jgi:hypothetical protein
MSIRGVTGRSFMTSARGSFHDLRIVLTSWSSVNRPSSTALSDTIAATGLLIDAAWKSVSGVPIAPVSASATP